MSVAFPTGTFRRHHLAEVDSTNSEARRQAESGEAAGLVITAERQTAGRGRRGRIWASPVGNLYFSMLLRPEITPAEAALTGFAISLAVAEVVVKEIGDQAPVHCKWPNDVLVGDRKVAGILVESASAGGDSLDWLIVGVGINLESHPTPAEKPATHLAAFGANVSKDDLLANLINGIDEKLELWRSHGFEAIRQAWLKKAWRLGQRVDLVTGKEQVAGAFADIDIEGGIVLELDGGERRHLGHGELMAQG